MKKQKLTEIHLAVGILKKILIEDYQYENARKIRDIEIDIKKLLDEL